MSTGADLDSRKQCRIRLVEIGIVKRMFAAVRSNIGRHLGAALAEKAQGHTSGGLPIRGGRAYMLALFHFAARLAGRWLYGSRLFIFVNGIRIVA